MPCPRRHGEAGRHLQGCTALSQTRGSLALLCPMVRPFRTAATWGSNVQRVISAASEDLYSGCISP